MFWKNKEKKKVNKQYLDIVQDIALTKSALDTAYANFESVVNITFIATTVIVAILFLLIFIIIR